MTANRFLVVLALAELSARGNCNWNRFISESRGVERPQLLPSYDDGEHRCFNAADCLNNWPYPHVAKSYPSTIVCDGVPICQRNRDDYDEDSRLCVPGVGVDLQLKKKSTTGSSVQLLWSRPTPSYDKGSWRMKLGGYFLTAVSKRDTVKKNLDYGILTYNLSRLTAGTTYQIILRPFYADSSAQPVMYLIGRASTMKLQTSASAPEAPQEVHLLAAGPRKVQLKVVDPFIWNGVPLGYRVRWMLKEGSGLSGEEFFKIPSSRPHSADWLNVVLHLEPGESYRILVTAINTDETNETMESPEKIVEVGTTPMEPTDLVAKEVGSGSVVVFWKSRGGASYFRVQVYRQAPSYSSLPLKVYWGKSGVAGHRIALNIPASAVQVNPNSARVPGDSLRHFVVQLAACSVTQCSHPVTTHVVPRSLRVPRPTITTVYSNDSTSFEVHWTVPDSTKMPIEGFHLRYCAIPAPCHEFHTHKKSWRATSLAPATTYAFEVRAKSNNPEGGTRLGRVARASVSTWSADPQQPSLLLETALSDTILLSWEFTNCSVSYIQISKIQGIWTNCTDTEDCTMNVVVHLTPYVKKGFLSLTNLMPYTEHSLAVRGCNDDGCGKSDVLQVRTGLSEPGEPLGLNVTTREDGSSKVVWDLPAQPAGPLDGFLVTWQCPPGDKFALTVKKTSLVIEDFPKRTGCTISVAGFNVDDEYLEGDLLVGKSAQLSFP